MRIIHFFSFVLCLFSGLASASGQSMLVTVEDHDSLTVYHDYWLQIKGALIGMVLAVPAALIAGLIVIL